MFLNHYRYSLVITGIFWVIAKNHELSSVNGNLVYKISNSGLTSYITQKYTQNKT